jgi:hypothetical protein
MKMKPVKELDVFGADGIKYEGRELSHEDMRELGVHAYDALGRRICRVVSVRSVKKGIVVKIIAPVFESLDYTKEIKGVIGACEKCNHESGDVVLFSAHVNGGGIYSHEFMEKDLEFRRR